MTIDERNKRLDVFFQECRVILEKKGKDYNPDDVAFSEVRNVAKQVGVTPEQALMVFVNKHFSAVMSHAHRGQVESEPIRERLKDVANYMALYAVMLEDRQ